VVGGIGIVFVVVDGGSVGAGGADTLVAFVAAVTGGAVGAATPPEHPATTTAMVTTPALFQALACMPG
jgi:hypothetical protein